jgi:hypothetical protein
MRFIASRCLALVTPLLVSVTACDTPVEGRGTVAPTAPSFSRGGKPASGTTFTPMEISPKSLTMSVGGTATVSVVYRDAKGSLVPETSFRWTYYGCVPVAPAALTTCNDLITLLPMSPYLRTAEIRALAPGQARIYASDGLGTYVWSDLTIQ